MKKILSIFIFVFVLIQIASADDTTKVAIFEYAGDGNSGTWITDASLDFQADFILIFSNEDSALWHCSNMGSGKTKKLIGATGLFGCHILDVDDDSFQVSANECVNKSGSEYYAVCIKTDNVKSKVGTYTGDGQDNRWINIGITVDFILIQGDNALGVWKTSDIIGDSSLFMTNGGGYGNAIQSIVADSIQIGTSSSVNANTHPYYYLALTEVDSICFIGKSPTGNQADERSTDLGWNYTPDFIMIDSKDFSTKTGFRTGDNLGVSGDWTVNAVGTNSTEAVDALISGGYTISYNTTAGFYFNNNSNIDYSLLLNKGSYITTTTTRKNVIVIW